MKRAGIDPALVEDVTMGCANPEGATGSNIARQAAIRAGLPVTAAAAAMAGLTRWVRAPGPCRPTKLRLEVEAQRSPAGTLSGFMPRHAEQPGSRHSNPAAVKNLTDPPEKMVRRELLELIEGMRDRLGQGWRDPKAQQQAAKAQAGTSGGASPS